MRIFYSPLHNRHNPTQEIYDGVPAPYAEVPGRVEAIADRLRTGNIELETPSQFGLEPIQAVHQQQYIDFVRTRSEQLAADDILFPSYFMNDTYAPLTRGTYSAALGAVDTALSGAQAIVGGKRVAYSLCRPPGHHAGYNRMGGYCYFNNAAIAAEYLAARGRVAILDIDYHHGNGTQEMFYDRDDVLYVSLHADPGVAYPYASGFAAEVGRGKGQGFTRNFPLPKATTGDEYIETLQAALGVIAKFQPDFLLVSVGFDTHQADPIAGLALRQEDYHDIAEHIVAAELPTLLIQEGGYNVELLPELASTFLQPFRKL